LTSASGFWGAGSYSFDALGNILSKAEGGATMTYNYNTSLNRLASITGANAMTFSYDERGNVTDNGNHGFDYNLAGNMTSSTSPSISYEYDGHERRVKKTEGGQTNYSVYSSAGTLMHKKVGGVSTDYIYAGSLLVAEQTGSTVDYMYTDLLGSPIAGNNGSSYQEHYRPWGEKNENPIQLADDVGYTGHQDDVATGLTYMQARYYDPVVGRFMAVDPVRFTASDPMSFNRFLYVNNNPYKYIDPNGEKLEFAAGSSASFKAQFAQVIKYHNKHRTSAVFARLQSRSETVTIKEGAGHAFGYNFKTDTVTFDPTSGLEVSPGQVQTPALGVLHEAGHAESDLANPVQHKADTFTRDPNYGDVEEKDVIQNVETPAAKKIGEPTRTNHGGTPVRVSCPTCDK
jgi:RHS repeat-associated protein